ncbi:hypothetical protein ISF_07383 [Cordyceps fumosorosea ARSEF 2679]|uniref:Uncharacterized protein n=1 Tax=Cordyceps fumosorosea (strain ARSEF 2679) TaxID=1081104 RepID=A0A167PNV3_CORFA|nr:hypothetical protein ISF_07383 [Cordyceps fumosorosea ARSEF 2679]OAA56867.1 hypothetical protein ISF_07383 [Cordyceps fumosorosea ARSEF 2679]
MRPESDLAEERSSATISCSALRSTSERHQRHFFTRLPPAPPLTPPELSTSIFACNEDVDGFISQPNPDYMSDTSSIPLQNSQPIPQTHSYAKMVTVEGHMPNNEGSASSAPTFSPGSYPGSAMLPPPPPGSQNQVRVYEDDTPRRNVNVQGEIISVVNQDGRGWSRHTRVYGGGACLACAASGGHEGGFYGATVTPEEMRY